MKNLLTILMFSIFIWSCNDDGGKLFSSIDLKSPLETTVDYCDISFAWDAQSINGDFVVDIATDSNFEHIVITDTIATKSYLIDGNLEPNQQYYWRVMADSESEIGSFTTTNENDLGDFVGTFSATAHHYVPWGGPHGDTTWTTTVQIDFTADELPRLSASNATITPWNFVSGTDCNILKYERNNFPTDMAFVEVELDLANRTFMFREYVDSWHFTIYTEYTGSID